MPRYTVMEPHPTAKKNTYVHSGRGGAGNTFRASSPTAAAVTASTAEPVKVSSKTSSSKRFYSGRGGAGNTHSPSERHSLSFAEEFASRAKASSSGHVGRGGAGNITEAKKHRKSSDASSSSAGSRRDSTSTGGSLRSGFFGRLSGISIGSHH